MGSVFGSSLLLPTCSGLWNTFNSTLRTIPSSLMVKRAGVWGLGSGVWGLLLGARCAANRHGLECALHFPGKEKSCAFQSLHTHDSFFPQISFFTTERITSTKECMCTYTYQQNRARLEQKLLRFANFFSDHWQVDKSVGNICMHRGCHWQI